LYARFSSSDVATTKSEKDLEFSIQKAYDLYYYLLLLLTAIKRYAESRIDLAKNKIRPTHEDLHPNTRFIDNRLIRQIEDSAAFNAYLSERKLSWVNHPELIKSLYRKLTAAEYYIAYMDAPVGSYEADRELLVDFFSGELEDHELFFQIMEEQSIFWNDDIDLVVSIVVKTIRAMSAEQGIKLLPMYKSDDDREFACTLLRASIQNHSEYEKLIDESTDNWDIERIALTDKLIMHMAINEFIEFPSIPIKVTFDEYLEVSKYYSTPKSSVFINGLLDKISANLIEAGKIVKIGRGLITES
jgi:N utilization substance protein B